MRMEGMQTNPINSLISILKSEICYTKHKKRYKNVKVHSESVSIFYTCIRRGFSFLLFLIFIYLKAKDFNFYFVLSHIMPNFSQCVLYLCSVKRYLLLTKVTRNSTVHVSFVLLHMNDIDKRSMQKMLNTKYIYILRSAIVSFLSGKQF